MVYIIPQQEHDGVLTYKEGIEAAHEAFVEYGDHPEYNETRHRIHAHDSGVRVSVHQAVCPRVGGAGLMTHTERPESDSDKQDLEYEAKLVHVLHDSETGELLALFIGELGAAEIPPTGTLTPEKKAPGAGRIAFRTACTSAVGLDELAPKEISTIGIFGSGGQARNHLVAFDQIRDFETGRVYSPTEAHRRAFAEEMSNVVDIEIEVVDTPDAIINGSDVVLAATSASSPVFDGELLEPGQTVISIVGSNIQLVESGHAPKPRREIDDATIRNSDLIVTNSVEQARQYQQADLYLPVDRGIIDWSDIVPLRHIVVEEHAGRSSDDDIVVYKNNAGEGIVDVSLARRIWDEIEKDDLDHEIDVFAPR